MKSFFEALQGKFVSSAETWEVSWNQRISTCLWKNREAANRGCVTKMCSEEEGTNTHGVTQR